ncbi:MAG: CDP-glycerol glycerophosphotransferase family protein [Cetobacterium sp.]
MKILKHFLDLNKVVFTYIVAKILKIFYKKDIWLISEREDEAQDNGYYLFKYIRKKHRKEKVYYLINRSAQDYEKIKKYKNIIQYNSLKHYIYYFMAEKHISAFQFFGVPNCPIIWYLEEKGFFKKKRCFLQHGVINARLPFLDYEKTKYDLFITSAEREYQYIKKNYGYPEKNVQYLGLCRHDKLHEKIEVKKKILIMPTWRSWLGMSNFSNDVKKDYENLINSDYYRKYSSLLKNKRLQNILEKKKYELLFYLHPEAQRFSQYFTPESNRQKIISRENTVLQDLLRESDILITDYSSLAFESAYMRKKIIYYQFDGEEYYKNHFERGYLDYETEGFGAVVNGEDGLVTEILKLIEEREVADIYKKRAEMFFPIYDNNNCKRNYEAIKKL